MKSFGLTVTVAIVSAVFCVAASAQTGRPSVEEPPAATAQSQVQAQSPAQPVAQVGSYART